MNYYYKQKQIIAKVDKQGNIIGKIEKWEAHKKGILHRGLSIALVYKNYFILQHRKHPAFDGVLDLTTSSHQLFIGEKLQDTIKAATDALKREWNIFDKDLIAKPKNLGFVYYKSKDPKSIYIEHEVCDMLLVKIKKIPTPNYDFAYGLSLVEKKELLNKKSRIFENLSPWTKVALENNLI